MLLRLFFCFSFSLAVGCLHAQDAGLFSFDEVEKTFFGGPVVGINAAQVDGDTYAGYHKLGLQVGGMVLWRFSKPLGISVELLYSQKGSRAVRELYDPYAGPGFAKYKLDVNYMEIPVLAQVFFTPKYQFGAGLSYNALISADEVIPNDYGGSAVQPDEVTFNKSEIEAIASLSMLVWKGLLLNIRYQYSLTPIRNWEHLNRIGNGDQFNNLFSFRAVYLF